MNCPNCGNQVSDSAKFCDYCGLPLTTAQAAAPTATYQQPAQPQPTATYQQPAQAQPTATYQQPQTSYQQAPVYAQTTPTVQTKKTSGVTKVVAIVLGLALAFGIGFLFRKGFTALWDKIFGTSSDSSTPAIELPTIDVSPDIDVDDLISDIDLSNILYIDEKNNPKSFAFLNADGETLVDALEDSGWTYDDEFLGWVSDSGNLFWVNGMDDYEYDDSEIKAFGPAGGDEVAIMICKINDTEYDSLDDIAECLIGSSYRDKFEDGDSLLFALSTIGLKDCMLHIYHDVNAGSYNVFFCNNASITSGYAADYLGVEGTTLADIWYYVSGRDLVD